LGVHPACPIHRKLRPTKTKRTRTIDLEPALRPLVPIPDRRGRGGEDAPKRVVAAVDEVVSSIRTGRPARLGTLDTPRRPFEEERRPAA
jgi:hypothetical protein